MLLNSSWLRCWTSPLNMAATRPSLIQRTTLLEGQASSPPMATSLRLLSCGTTDPGGGTVPVEGSGDIRCLALNLRHLEAPTSLTQSLSTLSTLTRLCLTAHRQTGDRELAALATLPSLEQLDILGNRNVSLNAVQELVASLPNLKLLDCSFCDQLGEQGVCQLRAQYPDVAIQWSFTDAG